jgi:nickel-type superoxide dismutase maturation protease
MASTRSWPVLVGLCELGWWLLGRRVRYRVTGRSMEPTLADGDQVLVDLASGPAVGDLVVAAHPDGSGRSVVKRVQELLGGGAVVLASDNPAEGTDSRRWGPVRPSSVQGRVTVILGRPFAGNAATGGRARR